MSQIAAPDSLRRSTRGINSEPSEIINLLSEEVGRAVWLLNDDFEVLWKNQTTDKMFGSWFYLGNGYCSLFPDLKQKLKEGDSSFCFRYKGSEWDVCVYKLNEKDLVKGYIVTIAKGITTRIKTLLERQRKREEILCSISLQPSPM